MYRQIDTGTWDDPWFAELEPDAKLVFLYLLTNRRSTAAGVFEITQRAIAFETGLAAKRVAESIDMLSSRIRWWPEHQTIWIRNFLRHQAPSPKFFKSAWSEMLEAKGPIRDEIGEVYPLLTDELPPPDTKEGIQELMEGYAKGMHTVSIGSRKTSLVKSSNRLVEDSSLEGADAPESSPEPKPKRSRRQQDELTPEQLERFDRWYNEYPKKVARADAEKAWGAIDPDDDLVDIMVSKTREWAASPNWTKDNGQFVPNPATWINRKRWTDDAPSLPDSSSNGSSSESIFDKMRREDGYGKPDSIDTTARRVS